MNFTPQAAIEQLEKMFYDFMLEGWAAGVMPNRQGPEPNLLGYETEIGNGYCSDVWRFYKGSGDGVYSHGETVVTLGDYNWFMTYGGMYPYHAHDIVRLALLDAYKGEVFYGGRGQREYKHGNLVYENVFTGSFTGFKGTEKVSSFTTGEVLGSHEYFGGILFSV